MVSMGRDGVHADDAVRDSLRVRTSLPGNGGLCFGQTLASNEAYRHFRNDIESDTPRFALQ